MYGCHLKAWQLRGIVCSPRLVEELKESNVGIQVQAVRALARWGTKDSIEPLIKFVDASSDNGVRNHLRLGSRCCPELPTSPFRQDPCTASIDSVRIVLMHFKSMFSLSFVISPSYLASAIRVSFRLHRSHSAHVIPGLSPSTGRLALPAGLPVLHGIYRAEVLHRGIPAEAHAD
jgi:hypothetical protein